MDIRLLAAAVLALGLGTTACGMSTAPDSLDEDSPDADAALSEQNYKERDWQPGAEAASDARYALAAGDRRLLGFALRATVAPGIDSRRLDVLRERCGLRFIRGFGDVIRDDAQRERMKEASVYARDYNRLILEACSPDDVDQGKID